MACIPAGYISNEYDYYTRGEGRSPRLGEKLASLPKDELVKKLAKRLAEATRAACELSRGDVSKKTKAWLKRHAKADKKRAKKARKRRVQ